MLPCNGIQQTDQTNVLLSSWPLPNSPERMPMEETKNASVFTNLGN